MDYSRRHDKDCAACASSDHWPGYKPELMRVCRQLDVMADLGGPRSCQDIARAPGSICGPEGHKFSKR